MSALDDLLSPTQVIVLNLMDYVHELNRNFSQYFKEPEQGIYFVHSVNPVLREDQKYYSETSYRTQAPLKALDKVTENVLDSEGRVVIPSISMAKKQMLLRKEPTLPVRALNIAFLVATAHIEENLSYRLNSMSRNEIRQHILPEALPYLESGYFDVSCRRLTDVIDRFIGQDTWSVYFTKMNNTDLIIEKCCDWRVYEYTRRMECGEWSAQPSNSHHSLG